MKAEIGQKKGSTERERRWLKKNERREGRQGCQKKEVKGLQKGERRKNGIHREIRVHLGWRHMGGTRL